MSTFEQYENLPGVKVSYEDGNLYTGNEAQSANTQSILILGTAVDGPVGEPVSVNAIGGPKAAEKLFGGMLSRQKIEENGEVKTVKVPHEGTLVRSMWEAMRAGNEDVRLLRVAGGIAKTELPAKGPKSEITQPLVDTLGSPFVLGNVAFSKPFNLPSDQRLVKVEKVEEFTGTDTTAAPLKTFLGATGYQTVDATEGSETVYFAKDKFRPNNTIKIAYKAKKRNYTSVSHNQDGVADVSTLGLLTQDPAQVNYFSSQVGNWSDDALHQFNVFVVDSAGLVNTIPSTNANGQKLWRVGKEDATVNELTDAFSAQEFSQGGIRFTSAYAAEGYPSLTSGVTVTVDYFFYNDLEIAGELTHKVPGAEKVTTLKFIPETDSLEVYFELNGAKVTMTETLDYTIKFPTDSKQKMEVRIKAGAGPVGAKLFAFYTTGENSTQDAKLIINARNAGKLYGGLEDSKDLSSLSGVQMKVEYEVNENGTVDLDNRVIRFIKPLDKKITSADTELRFRTKELRGVRTLREFANYVNGLAQNNVVLLDVPVLAGDVPLTGLFVTDYTINLDNGSYDYRPINLGEKYNEETMMFSLFVDDTKEEKDPARFPWLGTNGFFNSADIESTMKFYEVLGGKYEMVAGTLDEFELVEQGIYSKLENYSVDIVTVVDVSANTSIGGISEDGFLVVDHTKNFATQLAQHCAMVTAKTWETIGVLGLAPAPVAGLREIQQYIDLLTKNVTLSESAEVLYTSRGINPGFVNAHYMYNLATHEQVFNDDGEPIDIGRYVNVVFGPEVGLGHEKLGSYITNGASIYASLISQLNAEISTTNKAIAATGLRYSLSESQHNQLAGGRFVSFESKTNLNGSRSIVVKDGITAALPNSDYQRLSTVRITHTTVQLVRKKADKFIGLPNGIAQRNSLATEIQAGLDRLKELGVLNNFKFSIFSSAKDRVLGNAFITLELVPAYEMRKIFTSVALRASL